MKLNLKFQEESIQVLENFYLPDLAVIGGIAVETIVSSDGINTVLGGRGGRITLYLKKLGIKSNVFLFWDRMNILILYLIRLTVTEYL